MRQTLLGAILLFSVPLFAEDIEINLSFKSEKWQDTVVLLSSYQGNRLDVLDTLRLDKKGAVKHKALFPVGRYAITLPDLEQIELIFNERKIKVKQGVEEVTFPGSMENNLFNAFLKIERSIEKKRIKWQQGRGDKQILAQEIKSLETRRTVFKSINRDAMNKTFAGVLIQAISSPNDLVYYSQHIESAKWIKNRFLRGIDYTDERMYYTEIVHLRTQFFLDQVLENKADTIIEHLTELLEKSKPSKDMFRFLTDYYLHRYARSKNPQHEVVFKYLFENYCLTKQTPWIDEITEMRWNADIQSFRNQLIGEKPNPIELYDMEGAPLEYSFEDAKYTLLVFWDPGCAHCRVEVPRYHKVYKRHRKENFQAIGVYMQSFEEPWKTFIDEKNMNFWINAADMQQKGNLKTDYIIEETPTVLLIDSNGVLVNKRFTSHWLETFLEENL